MLHDPSDEQLSIVDSINDNNIVVDAVAGSGKTTTIMHIAKTHNKEKILLLTYNAKLKIESRQKAKQLGLTNLEVHSYHAFCVKYYDKTCFTDSKIIKILKRAKVSQSFNYDIVIIDEAQDMTNVYFELVCKILSEHKVKPKLCFLGDRNQSIFEFNNADSRFLVMANKLFNVNNKQWKTHRLSTSFRITKQMASFVNNCILGQPRLKSHKDGKPVRYIVCDTFGNKYGLSGQNFIPYNEVLTYLKSYTYEDIFILAPSVKSSSSPVRILANKLTEDGIPIYVPVSDEEKLDKDVVEGKIVFSTFHQVKGLERKVVLVFGFGQTYFQFYKKDKDPHICPDEIYVAVTRAQERLTVFHHYQDDFFKFVSKKNLCEHTQYIEYERLKLKKSKKNQIKALPVTDLVKHLSSSSTEYAVSMLKVKKIREASSVIDISKKTKQDDLYENVSDITGTTIPSYYEYLKTENISILEHLNSKEACSFFKGEYDFDEGVVSDKAIIKINPYEEEYSFDDYAFGDDIQNNNEGVVEDDVENNGITFIGKFLRMSNYFCAYMSGYSFKTTQIKEYKWLKEEDLDSCINRLDSILQKGVPTEHEVIVKYNDEGLLKMNGKYLRGSIDCIQDGGIYEFKCVTSVQNEHILQLAVYAFMYENHMLQQMGFELEKLSRRYKQMEFKKGTEVLVLLDGEWEDGIVTHAYKKGTVNVKVDGKTIRGCPKISVQHKGYFLEHDVITKKYTRDYKYYLYNILTDEAYEIKSDFEGFQKIVEYLILEKYSSKTRINDDTFLEKYKMIKELYAEDELEEDGIVRENIMVLDIETNGRNTIVEIAYNVYDKSLGLIKVADLLLNDGRGTIDYYKKIPLAEIVKEGVKPKEAIKRLAEDLDTCKYIVCHNIGFDMKHISRYICHYGINCHFPIEVDTMTASRNIVKAKSKNGRLKNPRLEELYKHLFGKSPNTDKCHRGTYDVKITAKCLKKLVDQQVVTL